MNGFENRVLNFIREKNMLAQGCTVVAGFSGGADSTALMLVLSELVSVLGIRLIAVHVNHGIRPEAGDDASFAQKFCEKRGIEFRLYEKDIPKLSKEWGMTEEEAGRRVRYEAFSEVLNECGGGVIAVAHHQNDVAESLLLNLLRGSGLHGAGSIRPVRGNIARPLLCVSRQDIEEYLSEKGQDFCHDVTNDENIHTRNIIRNVILPAMEKDINERAVAHLCRAAEDFDKADDYIRKVAVDKFSELSLEKEGFVELNLSGFRELDETIRANIILYALEQLTPARKDITSRHVDDILRICESSDGSAEISLPYSLVAVRSYDRLQIKTKDTENSLNDNKVYLIPSTLEIGDSFDIEIPKLGMAHIRVLQYNDGKLFPTSAYTKWFDYDRIQGAMFRKKRPEDYILIEYGDNKGALSKKKITKLMTDEKIPRDMRDDLYLLADGNNIIWVPGYRMSGAFKIGADTQKILEIIIDYGGKANG